MIHLPTCESETGELSLCIWKRFLQDKAMRSMRSNKNISDGTFSPFLHFLNISILNRNGYKISRIVKMKSAEINEKILEITENVHDFDKIHKALRDAEDSMRKEGQQKVGTQ